MVCCGLGFVLCIPGRGTDVGKWSGVRRSPREQGGRKILTKRRQVAWLEGGHGRSSREGKAREADVYRCFSQQDLRANGQGKHKQQTKTMTYGYQGCRRAVRRLVWFRTVFCLLPHIFSRKASGTQQLLQN